MTSLTTVEATCPECGDTWSATVPLSICTWLNPELVRALYDQGIHIVCPKCKTAIRVYYSLLLNCPKGMFYVDTGQDLFKLRCKLYEWGVVDFEGRLVGCDRNPQ